VKKIIKEDTTSVQPNTDGYNFQYEGKNGRVSSYITEGIVSEEINDVNGRNGKYKTMSMRIQLNKYGKEGRGDDSTRTNLASSLWYYYNTETNSGRLSFTYNFDGGNDFFKVVPVTFHSRFKKLITQLDEYSRTKMTEGEPKDDKKRKGMFGRN